MWELNCILIKIYMKFIFIEIELYCELFMGFVIKCYDIINSNFYMKYFVDVILWILCRFILILFVWLINEINWEIILILLMVFLIFF